MLSKFIDQYCRVIRFVMVVLLAIMFVLVAGNVVLRYGFNSGVTVSEELARWLFVWVVFLGAIVAMRDGAHLGTDSLVSRLPIAGKKFCFVLANILMLFVCWLLARGAWDQMVVNRGTTSPVMGASVSIFYASGLVLAVSGALILGNQLWRLISGQIQESELIGIRESEEEKIDLPAPLK